MKRLALSTAAILVLASIAIPQVARSQIARGTDLYDLMGTERLTQTDGSANLSWLPGARGYYSRSNMGFVRIDPANGRESSLFGPDVEASIQMQYAQLTGEQTDRLPFTRFQAKTVRTAAQHHHLGSSQAVLDHPAVPPILLPGHGSANRRSAISVPSAPSARSAPPSPSNPAVPDYFSYPDGADRWLRICSICPIRSWAQSSDRFRSRMVPTTRLGGL
jgi:hypothetical protein